MTGLYDLRARYYAPGLGRFLSQDTAGVLFGNPVELNRYVYTANDPVNRSDPSGLAFAEYVQNLKEKALRNVATLQRLGSAAQRAYIRALVKYMDLMPLFNQVMCIGFGFVYEGPDLPGCEFVDAIGEGTSAVRRIMKSDGSHFVSQFVDLVKTLAIRLCIEDAVEVMKRNWAVARYSIDDIRQPSIWSISGSSFNPSTELLERFLNSIGLRTAHRVPVTGALRPLVERRGYDKTA